MSGLNEAALTLASQQRTGEQLARGVWAPFLKKIPERKKPLIAFLMENERNWLNNLDEETRVAQIGSFEKFIFPMIKAVYPNLVSTDLVSVQPMQSPSSLIFYRDSRFGSNKGATKQGDLLFSARTGWNDAAGFNYSSEVVQDETIDSSADGSATPLGGSGTPTTYKPIRPGSLVVTYTAADGTTIKTLTDDGAGGLLGGAGELANSGNSVSYSTGVIKTTFASSHYPASGYPITVTYDYNSEGSTQIPQVDIVLTSTPVTARTRKLGARWSIEAAAQLKAVHGLEAETEIVTDMANDMRIEVDREVITDLLNLATANNNAGTIPVTQFSKAAPTNTTLYLHRQSFIYSIIEASNKIFSATRRHQANWILCGVNVANIVMGQEGQQFQSAGTVQGSGVQYIGTLSGLYRIYMDPYIDADTAIVGYKGDSMLDSGFVYAPYIPFYSTPTIYLDDFLGRKGLLTSYGKKPVNGLFYGLLQLT